MKKLGGIYMLWNSNYEIGNAVVDSEHKEIFGMVDKLLADDFTGRPDKIKTTIDFLAGYVLRHFDHEEQLMDESNYPNKDTHVKQHRAFIKTVEALVQKIEGNLDSIDLSLEVNKVIVEWLARHVMGSDKALVDHYRVWGANR